MSQRVTSFLVPDDIDAEKCYPKYYQVYTQLKKEIYFGEYHAGDRFLSLRDLRDRYSVDMQTIRCAIDLLVKDGFVYSKPGSGIFVNSPDKYRDGLSMGNLWFCQFGPEKNNGYYNGLLSATQEQASHKKLNVIVNRNCDLPSFKKWFQPETGDGLIVTGIVDIEILSYLRQRPNLRYVIAGNYELEPDVPNIHINIKDAVFKAMEATAAAGHRNLGLIAGPATTRATRDMLAGIDAAVQANLISYIDGVFGFPEDGFSGMKKLQDADIDCVFVTEPAFLGTCRYLLEFCNRKTTKMFTIRYGCNEDYDVFNDMADINMGSDKGVIAEQMLDTLFCNGPVQRESNIWVTVKTAS